MQALPSSSSYRGATAFAPPPSSSTLMTTEDADDDQQQQQRQQQQQQQQIQNPSSNSPTLNQVVEQQQQEVQTTMEQDQNVTITQNESQKPLGQFATTTTASESQLITPEQILIATAAAEEAKLLESRGQQILDGWKNLSHNIERSQTEQASSEGFETHRIDNSNGQRQKNDLVQLIEQQNLFKQICGTDQVLQSSPNTSIILQQQVAALQEVIQHQLSQKNYPETVSIQPVPVLPAPKPVHAGTFQQQHPQAHQLSASIPSNATDLSSHKSEAISAFKVPTTNSFFAQMQLKQQQQQNDASNEQRITKPEATDHHHDESNLVITEDAATITEKQQSPLTSSLSGQQDHLVINGLHQNHRPLSDHPAIADVVNQVASAALSIEQLTGDEQPRMKSILDFDMGEINADEPVAQAIASSGPSSGNNKTDRSEPMIADDAQDVSQSDQQQQVFTASDGQQQHLRHTATAVPMEQTRFAAIRIEERIMNEKLTANVTGNGKFTGSAGPCSVISSPQSQATAPSPRSSDSVPTTPNPNNSFCRAPGLGPVIGANVGDVNGTQAPQSLVCSICGFSCNSKFHYNSHMNTHGDHQCTMCDYTSRTEGRLKKHMRDSHTAEEQLAAGMELIEQSSSAGSTSTSNTPVSVRALQQQQNVSAESAGLSTSMSSVLEAANLAVAAQAAAAAAAKLTGAVVASASSESGSGFSMPSDCTSPPPPSDLSAQCAINRTSSVENTATSSTTTNTASSSLPSALDQIRAFTENPSILPDLSSANLASALISHGFLQAAQDCAMADPTGDAMLGAIEEPCTSGNAGVAGSVNGDRTRTCPSKPKIYKCKQCSHVSNSKDEQWDHSRTHIPVEKQLCCTRCGFVTEYKHHLEYHLRNHMGSKPFQCKKCAYSCVNKSMLNSHMKSHTNVYQFRCSDCTYATKYCHSLKLHLRKYNHTRATDVSSDPSRPGPSGLSNGSLLNEDSNAALLRLSEACENANPASSGSSANNTILSNTDNPSCSSPQSCIPQSLANAMGLSSMVSGSPLNLASQILLSRHQQQIEQMDAMLHLKNLANLNSAGLMLPRCSICDFQALNQDEHIRHQMGHLIASNSAENPLATLYNSFVMPSNLQTSTGNDAPSPFASNCDDQLQRTIDMIANPTATVNVDECMDEYEKPTTSADNIDCDQIMSDDASGELEGSPNSAKNSIEEAGCSGLPGKGARKRKAGLKLNQIAARLHEKNSPEGPNQAESVNEDIKCEEQNDVMMKCEGTNEFEQSMAHEGMGVIGSSASENTPIMPHPQILNPFGLQNELAALGNLNIFQQACIAHMQDMERKLCTLDMWRFSCAHCKMAFQDEPLYHIHMGYHGYENPFKCNRCGQLCADFLTFNLHLLQAQH